MNDVPLHRLRLFWLSLGCTATAVGTAWGFAVLKNWIDWWTFILSTGPPVTYSWPSTFAAISLLVFAPICFTMGRIIRDRQDAERRQRGNFTAEELKQEIESRKRRALNAKIAEKAGAIVDVLGSAGCYRSSGLELAALKNDVVIRVASEHGWSNVFEAKLIPGSHTFTERRFLEPAYDRPGLEFTKELSSFSTPSRYDIIGYIPGDWEKTLEGMVRDVVARRVADQKEKERLALASKNALLEEQRERFGLPGGRGQDEGRLSLKQHTDEERA